MTVYLLYFSIKRQWWDAQIIPHYVAGLHTVDGRNGFKPASGWKIFAKYVIRVLLVLTGIGGIIDFIYGLCSSEGQCLDDYIMGLHVCIKPSGKVPGSRQ